MNNDRNFRSQHAQMGSGPSAESKASDMDIRCRLFGLSLFGDPIHHPGLSEQFFGYSARVIENNLLLLVVYEALFIVGTPAMAFLRHRGDSRQYFAANLYLAHHLLV